MPGIRPPDARSPPLTPVSSILPPTTFSSLWSIVPSQTSSKRNGYIGSSHSSPKLVEDSLLSPSLSRTTYNEDEEDEQERWAGNMMHHPDIVLAMDVCRFHAGDRKPIDPFWRPYVSLPASLHSLVLLCSLCGCV